MGHVSSCSSFFSQTLEDILSLARLLPAPRFPCKERAATPAAVLAPDLSKAGDTETPVTALQLFDGMTVYAYANGHLVGVESSSRTVLWRQRLPEQIFCDAHRRLAEIPCLKRGDADMAGFVASFKRDHLEVFKPVLLIANAADWPALRKWDLDFFTRSCGHIEVEVTLQHGKRHKLLLGDYLALLQSAGEVREATKPSTLPYLRGWYYEHDAPWLSHDLWQEGDFHDIAFQDYFRKLPRRHHPDFHWLFIGGAGSVTPLHVDPSGTHAWLTQIHGRKRFTLFAPCEMAKLLKETPGGGFKPLREILSERLALSLEVVLHPGDTLFVPAHWPHEVECLDDSISVTWNFLGQSVFPLVRAAFLAHTTR